MNVPHKVKIFIKDIVPTKVKLNRYKKDITPICSRCTQAEETLNHLLIECHHSRAVWFGMNVNVSSLQDQHIQVKEWILSWFSQTTGSAQVSNNWTATIMITAWFVWKNRCLKEFENKNQNLHSTIYSINNLLKLFIDGNLHGSKPSAACWIPPNSDVLKLNIDASFDHTSTCVGVGLIIRNSTGTCEGIRGRFFNGGVDPEHAECLAFQEAIY
ncbi:uncharacterized protein LOC113343883 [Papaver somniferum]|uniref:uncharacterized protein LOC113343883 n=1 Tax=Papaver somniferum TaxID=3469 RepID=UPI000E70253C|nr:uncharacterized protein LOC113343883 [Papaver somniferum]